MKTSLCGEKIKYILRTGKRYAHNNIIIICVGNRTDRDQRYAILISKKAEKTAVARNRVRRVIRETVKIADIPCGEFVILHNKQKIGKKEVKKQSHI